MSQSGNDASQIFSILEWLLREFCTLCSVGTCLAQKEIACRDSRACSQLGAEEASWHTNRNEVEMHEKSLRSQGRTGWRCC